MYKTTYIPINLSKISGWVILNNRNKDFGWQKSTVKYCMKLERKFYVHKCKLSTRERLRIIAAWR